MSVERSVFYGYGYYVSDAEIEKTFENEDYWDEFLENDFVFHLNSWSCEKEFFFGIKIASAEEGTAKRLNSFSVADLDPIEVEDMKEYFAAWFPDRDPEDPDFYLVFQIS